MTHNPLFRRPGPTPGGGAKTAVPMTDKKLKDFTEPGPTEAGGGDIFAVGEPRMVSVRMFEREYQIKSDQPQLVALLVDEINREAKKLQEVSPIKMGPGNFDWPVQVAFQLALGRFRALEAYNTLKRQTDAEAEKMARRINSGLDDLEAERLARRITADLKEVEMGAGRLGQRFATGLNEAETGKLAQRITAGLDDLEADKLAQRVTAELDQVEIEAERIAQRLLVDLGEKY